jgi:hypothetical protein
VARVAVIVNAGPRAVTAGDRTSLLDLVGGNRGTAPSGRGIERRGRGAARRREERGMSMHGLFARSGRDRAWRVRAWRARLRLARCGLGLPGLTRRGPAGPVRLPPRVQRRLAAIDRALAAEAPGLASMFATFNELTADEAAVGAERLPPRVRPRPRAYLTEVAVLTTLAAIVALLCVALSTPVHTVMRPCLAYATAGRATSSSTEPAAGPAAYGPARVLSCQAYDSANK